MQYVHIHRCAQAFLSLSSEGSFQFKVSRDTLSTQFLADLFLCQERLYNSFSDHLNFFFAHHYFLPCHWLKENRQIQLLPRFSVSHFNFFIRSLAFCTNNIYYPACYYMIILTMQWLKQTLPAKYLHWTQSCNYMKSFCCSHLDRMWIYSQIIFI